MAKIFTITEGLENLGALKSGGQGSVYKARRTGGLISAVKILPTPISSESDADKNFISFQNEVEKLKRVNETPNPNVVSILSSGITSSGNLPFIEMEYIEGPDLAELLKAPHDPVFTIQETIKVADHLSNALAHCHRAAVKHGDIKSNNVKFNQLTDNYMLLDFGLSVMSDEQRRTSIRYAGAIEFMAPEQSAGETLFETDVYSFGIILFELLAGTVPFPLANKGEMARNAVMVAHMENPVPDLPALRRHALPVAWSDDKKEKEMQVPEWLLHMTSRCLQKNPADRFKHGTELHDFIRAGMVADERRNITTEPSAYLPAAVVVSGPLDNSLWKEQVQQLQAEALKHEQLINELKYQVEVKDKELYQLNMQLYNKPVSRGISRSTFFTVLIIALSLGGYAMYHSLIKPNRQINTTKTQDKNKITGPADSSFAAQVKPKKASKPKVKRKVSSPVTTEKKVIAKPRKKIDSNYTSNPLRKTNRFRVKRNAFFHDLPDKHTRNSYYVRANLTLTAIAEKAEFIYVKFTDGWGNITRTWLSKEDLNRVYE